MPTAVTYTGTGTITSVDYRCIKWTGKTKSGVACEILMPRAICRSNPDWTFNEKDDVIAAIEFEGLYDDADLAAGNRTEPWTIKLADSVSGNGSILLGAGKFSICRSADNYSVSQAYAVGDYTFYNGKVYKCKTAISSPGEAWTAAHWDEEGPTAIGLTRGGGKFVVERTIREINADDDPGAVAGRLEMTDARPKMTLNAVQWLGRLTDLYPGLTTVV